MAQIKNEKELKVALERIEELLPQTWGDNVSEDSSAKIELNLLSALVADYEDEHVHIEKPSLLDIIKLRMYEMGLNNNSLAALLGISSPGMDDIIHGKKEPSLSLARTMSQKLNISPEIVLGV
ncbi:MAG: transcriptional regulator [Bacteroidales bacterium]|nr:transcriptional regulator [Bacteroidales bacterium]